MKKTFDFVFHTIHFNNFHFIVSRVTFHETVQKIGIRAASFAKKMYGTKS